MSHQLKRPLPYLFLLLFLVFTAGCGGSSIQEISGQQGFQQGFAPDTLIIKADRTQLTVGETATLTARLHPSEGEVRDVTDLVSWSSSAATVAAAPGAHSLRLHGNSNPAYDPRRKRWAGG